MDDKLEIIQQQSGQLTILVLKGRLDAFWSNRLGETLDKLIRDGSYDLRLDMNGVQYMSSAGIRILLNYVKKLKEIQGSLWIVQTSDKVKSVLEMAGLDRLFIAGASPPEQRKTDVPEERIVGNTLYSLHAIDPHHTLQGTIAGDPGLIYGSTVSQGQVTTMASQRPLFGVGMGAFGDDFMEYKHRFGEFIGLGDVLACLPTDGKNEPDYLMTQGQWFPTAHLLYGILFEGTFSHRIHFESIRKGQYVRWSQLLEDLRQFTGFTDMGMLMVAETNGLIGMSLTRSPVALLETNQELFSFPAIREQVNFTPEHAYEGMLTLTTGMLSTSAEEWRSRFLRPTAAGKSMVGHFHSAVFSYHPLKKQISDYRATVQTLFNQHHFFTILHLTHDQRPVEGSGESEFKHGTCWLGPISSFNDQTGPIL